MSVNSGSAIQTSFICIRNSYFNVVRKDYLCFELSVCCAILVPSVGDIVHSRFELVDKPVVHLAEAGRRKFVVELKFQNLHNLCSVIEHNKIQLTFLHVQGYRTM
jgi:hypothetical protein